MVVKRHNVPRFSCESQSGDVNFCEEASCELLLSRHNVEEIPPPMGDDVAIGFARGDGAFSGARDKEAFVLIVDATFPSTVTFRVGSFKKKDLIAFIQHKHAGTRSSPSWNGDVHAA